jgi:hypothetical protein
MLPRIILHNRGSGDEKADSRDGVRLPRRLSGRVCLFYLQLHNGIKSG